MLFNRLLPAFFLILLLLPDQLRSQEEVSSVPTTSVEEHEVTEETVTEHFETSTVTEVSETTDNVTPSVNHTLDTSSTTTEFVADTTTDEPNEKETASPLPEKVGEDLGPKNTSMGWFPIFMLSFGVTAIILTTGFLLRRVFFRLRVYKNLREDQVETFPNPIYDLALNSLRDRAEGIAIGQEAMSFHSQSESSA